MKLLIFVVMLISNTAALKDMSDKMFTFSQRTENAYVKVNTEPRSFSAITLCHRTFTDLQRTHTFFSLTTSDFNTYGYHTRYSFETNKFSVWVKSVRADFGHINYAPNKWYSICTTWDSSSGVVQLWLNGEPLSKKYNAEFPITGQPKIILGQEQRNYSETDSSGFTESFSGMMTDVHMWDSVLPPCEIHRYMSQQSFTPGNVINWAALDCEPKGIRLIVDDKQNCDSTL